MMGEKSTAWVSRSGHHLMRQGKRLTVPCQKINKVKINISDMEDTRGENNSNNGNGARVAGRDAIDN